ncbi:DUF3270 domain-containing protein [Streptococcus sobrinus]|uniref:DUF3270 family protein n=5 Tax=Streptococcus sobrinus TaxID=1310 RepID=U2J1G5_9STRE|nr:DUF3270 domain-containing protein [Streptococcus sobrinus]AWN19322.1 DUF3270 domain-containing protein [Streptococcus sobrinus]AWN20374.1 DUF3270 domain-containing protein [Streptococcus sobrinus]AWN61211.1 DUF3270 domain-containing protein [Streptococcus sobrinus]AWN63084.1 DUF3270 domain-containing protein [Streptococcus sobrinus]ERJ73902.1 hypothetical protein HMPREF1557_02009 [Streptococcus sobrinus W1703]
MAAQRQDDFDYYNNQESQNQTNQNQPKYQEFYQVDNQSAKLRELLFFARIALFCISSVLLTFLFLTMGLGTLIAFSLAVLLGIAITSTISTFVLSMKKK